MKVQVVSLTDHRRDVRFQKLRRTLIGAGAEVAFAGVCRDDLEEDASTPGCSSIPLTLGSRSAQLTALPVVRAHFAQALSTGDADVIYCVNEESLLLCSGLLGGTAGRGRPGVVLDLYDSLGLRTIGAARIAARPAARAAQVRADAILVTDARRLALLDSRVRAKAHVIENFPEYEGADAPSLRAFPEGPVRILAAGGLSEDRGIVTLARAAEAAGALVLALGRPDGAARVQDAMRSPSVRFEGYAPQVEVFALAATCDALFGHYEPSSTNSIFASPNKLFDAYRVGRPLLINTEVEVARAAEYSDVVLATPFAHVDALVAELRRRRDARAGLPRLAESLFERGRREFSWEAQQGALLSVLTSVARSRR